MKLYNTKAWKQLRAQFLANNPVCWLCKIRPATDCDHIIRHRGDKKLFLDARNLQPLCRDCHSKKSAAERRLGGRMR